MSNDPNLVLKENEIIILDKVVLEKVWNGTTVQIISYNPEYREFRTKDISSGKEFTHMSNLDCRNLSFKNSNDGDVIEYLIKKGILKLSRIPTKYYELIQPTKEEMKKLIVNLEKIQNSDLKIKNKIYYDTDQKIIADTIVLLDNCLISPEGGCNWDNIKILEDKGYKVYAGEKDGYGWLTGCVKNNKGYVLVYG